MLNLFKKKSVLLILVTMVLIIIIGISAKQGGKSNFVSNVLNTIISPIQKIFFYTGQKVEGSVTFFNEAKTLKLENDKLKKKVDQLEKDKRELIRFEVENKELRAAFNLKQQFSQYDFLGSNIIAKDAGNWFNVFTIDIGSKDGINNYYAVATSRGLVGCVTKPELISSKVVSIIDMDSTVSGIVSRTRELVRVKGDLTLKDQGLCRMDYISPDADLIVGDTIETSGVGGIFPKGILIGRVKEIKKTNNELNRYAIIEPAVDFKRLEQVFVLRDKNIK